MYDASKLIIVSQRVVFDHGFHLLSFPVEIRYYKGINVGREMAYLSDVKPFRYT
jgi:hypothetical protein